MRISDSAEEAAWRAEVREFLEKELPASLRNQNRGIRAGATEYGSDAPARGKPEARPGGAGFKMADGAMGEWREKLAARGWVAPAWPQEYGGAGLNTMEQFIMNEEFAEAGAPTFG